MSALAQKLEAILFWKGESESVKKLAEALGVKKEEAEAALQELESALTGRGLRLMRRGEEVALVTAPEAAECIEALRKDELSRDLGKAGAEVLAVVLYRGPSTRAEIEYVRGVNCASILRSLTIRGLVEKVPSPERKGSFQYHPTADLLAHLGVAKAADLPEYEALRNELGNWEKAEQAKAEAEE